MSKTEYDISMKIMKDMGALAILVIPLVMCGGLALLGWFIMLLTGWLGIGLSFWQSVGVTALIRVIKWI